MYMYMHALKKLGYLLVQLLRILCVLQTFRMHPKLDIYLILSIKTWIPRNANLILSIKTWKVLPMYLQCALELAKTQDFERGSKKEARQRNDLPQSRKWTDFPTTKERLSRVKRAKTQGLFILNIRRLLQRVSGKGMNGNHMMLSCY